MMTKICLFVDYNMYEVLRHFTEQLAIALRRQGAAVQIIDAQRQELSAERLQQLIASEPTFTASFCAIQQPKEGLFLWDLLRIPHVSFLVDPALYAVELTKSPYSMLTSVDRSDVQAVGASFERISFWPHAVEKELIDSSIAGDRPYDVVFFGSCFDYEAWRRHWQQQLPPVLCTVVEDAIARILISDRETLAEALVAAVANAGLDVGEWQSFFMLMYHYIDKYTRGKERTDLVRAIRNVPIHIFGETPPDNVKGLVGWSHYLADQANVTIHPSVTFTESFEILKRSKFCLNSMPFFRHGTHERIFTGLACGVLPISSYSSYLHEQFKEGEELLYYSAADRGAVGELIASYLCKEEERRAIVAAGQAQLLKAHTWDHRAEALLRQMDNYLSQA
jgi:hypothetical protein